MEPDELEQLRERVMQLYAVPDNQAFPFAREMTAGSWPSITTTSTAAPLTREMLEKVMRKYKGA